MRQISWRGCSSDARANQAEQFEGGTGWENVKQAADMPLIRTTPIASGDTVFTNPWI